MASQEWLRSCIFSTTRSDFQLSFSPLHPLPSLKTVTVHDSGDQAAVTLLLDQEV